MPLWTIYHPPTTFTTQASKSALAQDITKIYHDPPGHLPAFYVVVNFIAIDPTNQFIGGEPPQHRTTTPPTPPTEQKPFIRIHAKHIAVRQPDDDEAYRRVTERIDGALKTHVEDRGYDWEYHVEETERRLWRINGVAPPEWKGEGERKWREANMVVPL